MPETSPYATILPFIGSTDKPGWVNDVDANRVAAYGAFGKIYDNVPETFKLVARGSQNNPIYVPSGKTIVEACNRFLAVGFDYRVVGANETETAQARLVLDRLFRREEFYSKFSTVKRWTLIRGDGLLHITADPTKPAGSRISINELDPANYFPVADDNDSTKVTKIYIATYVRLAGQAEKVVRRTVYDKTPDGFITSVTDFYKSTAWDDRINPETGKPFHDKIEKVGSLYPPTTLPIKAWPVYHIRNNRRPNDLFGRSEMAGIERIMAAVNQAISDEELTLALDGLGVYATNAGAPVNNAGQKVAWSLGPGKVIELPVGKEFDFKRVTGTATIEPVQDHVGYLHQQMRESSGTPDTAVGSVDVQVAQSGIALALQMAPLLAKNGEKESEMLSTYDHMFYDLVNSWFPAYEAALTGSPATIDVFPHVGDPMPTDRAAVLAETKEMIDMGVWTIPQAQSYLAAKLGFDFSESSVADLSAQVREFAGAADPFGQRLNTELGVDDAQPTA